MDWLPNLNVHLITRPVALIAFGILSMLVLLGFGAPWYVVMVVILVILASGLAALV
jgi:hypothetical protein